tara:strand:+ start:239 stop:1081 length:843 start_codon:yes stop_codon:yes gene_type:complete
MEEIVNTAISFKIIPFLIPLLFYFLGITNDLRSIKQLLSEKKSLIYGLILQIILLPLIGILSSRVFDNSIFIVAALIVLIVPGGHVSGLLTHIKKGNVPLSVALTSLASILSPLTIIFWLNIASLDNENLTINFIETFIQLTVLVLLPFIVGVYTKIKKPEFAIKSSSKLDNFLRISVLILSFTGPFELKEIMIDNFIEGSKIAVFSLLSIILISYLLSKIVNIRKVDLQTITIEGLCQNFPIVIVLGLTFNMPEIIVYGVIYYLISMLFAVTYTFTKKN